MPSRASRVHSLKPPCASLAPTVEDTERRLATAARGVDRREACATAIASTHMRMRVQSPMLTMSAIALPALLLQGMLTFGVACFAATVTTFLRDVAHGIGIALTVLFYATPIVYPAALMPAP